MMRRQGQIIVAILITILIMAIVAYALVKNSRASSENLLSGNTGALNSQRDLAQANASPYSDSDQQPSVQREPQVRVIEPPVPSVEGKAMGKLKPLNHKKDLRSALLAHPTPEIWLEFPNPQSRERSDRAKTTGDSPVIKVQLPPEAKRLLREHWKAICVYYYSELIGKKSPRAVRVKRLADMYYANAVVITNLETMAISVPDGSRMISLNEAGEIVRLLDAFAKELFLPFSGQNRATA